MKVEATREGTQQSETSKRQQQRISHSSGSSKGSTGAEAIRPPLNKKCTQKKSSHKDFALLNFIIVFFEKNMLHGLPAGFRAKNSNLVRCVTFHGVTDCRELVYCLPDVVVLNPGEARHVKILFQLKGVWYGRCCEVVIYPNQKAPNLASFWKTCLAQSGVFECNLTSFAEVKPPVGSGLNKPSTIKLCAAARFFELPSRVIESPVEGTGAIQRVKSSRTSILALGGSHVFVKNLLRLGGAWLTNSIIWTLRLWFSL